MLNEEELKSALAASPSPDRITPEYLESRVANKEFERVTDTTTICLLTTVNGFEVIVVEREEPAERQSRGIQPSEASPAHCTGVGKALLAFQRTEVIEQVISAGLKIYTTTTISTSEGLRTELAAIRQRGYAIDDSEHQVWVRCVAAPIRNSSGHVFASVSVTGPADRMTDTKIASLAPLVIQTADSISRQIGFEPTP